MRITEITYDGAPAIDGYGPGFFRVAGIVHYGAILVAPGGARPWAGLDDPEPLLALAGGVDVLFIGMGSDIAPLPRGLGARLEAAGLGVEHMASPAAARTFNVLLAEGRRIAAALIPVASVPGR